MRFKGRSNQLWILNLAFWFIYHNRLKTKHEWNERYIFKVMNHLNAFHIHHKWFMSVDSADHKSSSHVLTHYTIKWNRFYWIEGSTAKDLWWIFSCLFIWEAQYTDDFFIISHREMLFLYIRMYEDSFCNQSINQLTVDGARKHLAHIQREKNYRKQRRCDKFVCIKISSLWASPYHHLATRFSFMNIVSMFETSSTSTSFPI